MPELKIEYLEPSALQPWARNARTHSKAQIQSIAKSIEVFGFNNPILIDRDNKIVAGHGRVEAARLLALTTVPAVRLEHLSETQRRAYIIADNRLAELAGWDDEMLAIELGELSAMELDFEITNIGFETGEIDLILADGGKANDRPDPADDISSLGNVPKVTRLGDLWLLGGHRLFCGDAQDAASFTALLGSERAQMMFSDPPYNVPIDGHVSGLGRARHNEFVMASGEMSEVEFTRFLYAFLENAVRVSVEGAVHFVCMDWRHLNELLGAGQRVYAKLQNLCVWVKANGGMGSLYRSQHELIAVFKVGSGKHINNVQLGRHGRNRTNVWHYAGMNSFHGTRSAGLAMHPTLKPIALVADAICDCSARGAIVLDPFGGAGTTIIAAERVGRRAFVIELDPKFVDVSLARFARETGIIPVNASTGQLFPIKATTSEKTAKMQTAGRSGDRRHG